MQLGKLKIEFKNMDRQRIIVFVIQGIILAALAIIFASFATASIEIDQGVNLATTNTTFVTLNPILTHFFLISDNYVYFEDMPGQGYNYSLNAKENTTIRIDSIGRFISGWDHNKLENIYMEELPTELSLNYSEYNLSGYFRQFRLNLTEDTDKSLSTQSNYSGNRIGLNYSLIETGYWTNRTPYVRFAISQSLNATNGSYSVNLTPTVTTGTAQYNDYVFNWSNISRSHIISVAYDFAPDHIGANCEIRTYLTCTNGSGIFELKRTSGSDIHIWASDRFIWHNHSKYLAFVQNNTLLSNNSYDCFDLQAIAFFTSVAPGYNISFQIDNLTITNGTEPIFVNNFETEYDRKYMGYNLTQSNYSFYKSNNITRQGKGINFIPYWDGTCNISNCEINISIDGQIFPNVTNASYYNYSGLSGTSMYFSARLLGTDFSNNITELSNFRMDFSPLIKITFLANDAITNATVEDLNITIENAEYSFYQNKQEKYNISFLLIPELDYNITISGTDHAKITYFESFRNNGTFRANIFKKNSVWINILNISSGESVFENVTIRLIGPGYYENNTNQSYIYLEDLTPGNYTISVLSSDYKANQYRLEVAPDSFQYVNIYLISNSVASSVAFTTMLKNSDTYVIEGVIISVQKYINGSKTIVSALETDITGKALFYYQEGELYYFLCQKEGYKLKNFSLNPIFFAAYTIRMEVSTAYSDQQDMAGVLIVQEPRTFKATTQNISISFTSPAGILTGFGYNVTFQNTTVSASGLNVYGAVLDLPLSLANATFGDSVIIEHYYTTAKGQIKSYKTTYYVDVSDPNKPLWSNIMENSGNYGLGIMERTALVTIVILVVAGLTFLYSGNIELSATLSVLMIGIFTYTEIIPKYVIALAALAFLLFINFRGTH